MPKGWRLTFTISMLVSCTTLPILFLAGLQPDTIELFLRTTARCSTILFLLAFTASAMAQLFPNIFARWVPAIEDTSERVSLFRYNLASIPVFEYAVKFTVAADDAARL